MCTCKNSECENNNNQGEPSFESLVGLIVQNINKKNKVSLDTVIEDIIEGQRFTNSGIEKLEENELFIRDIDCNDLYFLKNLRGMLMDSLASLNEEYRKDWILDDFIASYIKIVAVCRGKNHEDYVLNERYISSCYLEIKKERLIDFFGERNASVITKTILKAKAKNNNYGISILKALSKERILSIELNKITQRKKDNVRKKRVLFVGFELEGNSFCRTAREYYKSLGGENSVVSCFLDKDSRSFNVTLESNDVDLNLVKNFDFFDEIYVLCHPRFCPEYFINSDRSKFWNINECENTNDVILDYVKKII